MQNINILIINQRVVFFLSATNKAHFHIYLLFINWKSGLERSFRKLIYVGIIDMFDDSNNDLIDF